MRYLEINDDRGDLADLIPFCSGSCQSQGRNRLLASGLTESDVVESDPYGDGGDSPEWCASCGDRCWVGFQTDCYAEGDRGESCLRAPYDCEHGFPSQVLPRDNAALPPALRTAAKSRTSSAATEALNEALRLADAALAAGETEAAVAVLRDANEAIAEMLRRGSRVAEREKPYGYEIPLDHDVCDCGGRLQWARTWEDYFFVYRDEQPTSICVECGAVYDMDNVDEDAWDRGERLSSRTSVEGGLDNYGDSDITVAEVARIPPCDYCGKPAQYDAETAFMCRGCFEREGTGRGLGTGKGQRLVLVSSTTANYPNEFLCQVCGEYHRAGPNGNPVDPARYHAEQVVVAGNDPVADPVWHERCWDARDDEFKRLNHHTEPALPERIGTGRSCEGCGRGFNEDLRSSSRTASANFRLVCDPFVGFPRAEDTYDDCWFLLHEDCHRRYMDGDFPSDGMENAGAVPDADWIVGPDGFADAPGDLNYVTTEEAGERSSALFALVRQGASCALCHGPMGIRASSVRTASGCPICGKAVTSEDTSEGRWDPDSNAYGKFADPPPVPGHPQWWDGCAACDAEYEALLVHARHSRRELEFPYGLRGADKYDCLGCFLGDAGAGRDSIHDYGYACENGKGGSFFGNRTVDDPEERRAGANLSFREAALDDDLATWMEEFDGGPDGQRAGEQARSRFPRGSVWWDVEPGGEVDREDHEAALALLTDAFRLWAQSGNVPAERVEEAVAYYDEMTGFSLEG